MDANIVDFNGFRQSSEKLPQVDCLSTQPESAVARLQKWLDSELSLLTQTLSRKLQRFDAQSQCWLTFHSDESGKLQIKQPSSQQWQLFNLNLSHDSALQDCWSWLRPNLKWILLGQQVENGQEPIIELHYSDNRLFLRLQQGQQRQLLTLGQA